ncbi:MAG TPA: lysozyme inhibitor LprI family protein [Xanthobacteraceae bacterium]|nr:lysozyme inhibitor LprI family protein [Xanthobacteraceae bacterium]
MAARNLLAVAVILAAPPLACAQAEPRKPTAKEVSAIRSCAAKYQDDLDAVERECLFKLVGDPCTQTADGSSNVGTADCYRTEWAIWDNLLNENFKNLRDELDDEQTAKLREMQRAWIAYRDATCNFYWDKIQGTMAIPMHAACFARETARRAVLLNFFSRM